MNPAVPMPAPAARAYVALLVLTGINLLNYMDRYVIAGILPLIQGEFGKTDTQMGIVSSSFLVVYSVASPFTGILGDRFPRKWFIGGGVLVWSAATVWSGRASSFEELLVARALIGVGEAGYAAMAPSFISDLFDPARRGRMLSLFYAAMPVGIAIGYAVGGWVGANHGWRTAFLVAGLPGVALALVAFLLPEPVRGGMDAHRGGDERPSPLTIARTLLRTRSFLVNTAGTTAMTFAMGGLGAWMPTFLNRERGVPLDDAGVWFGGTLIVAGFLGTLAGGFLGDRLGARHKGGYFLCSGGGLVLGVPGALVAALATDPAIYWPAIFAALFFLFFNTGPLNAALVNVVPATMRASAVAANVLVIHMLGDALSPTVIGSISDASSLGRAIVVNAFVIALAGAILLLGAGVLRKDMEAIAAGKLAAER